jgi:hypothetical protein
MSRMINSTVPARAIADGRLPAEPVRQKLG